MGRCVPPLQGLRTKSPSCASSYPGLQPGLRYFAPLGLTCPPSPPRRGKTDYAREARKNCVFLLREGGPRRAFSPAVAGRMRGLFPSGPAANKEYSFILLHTSADKRSGGVSGALRGGQGRETGLGTQPVDSSLSTRHLSLSSSRPAAGSLKRARNSHTGMDRACPCVLPAPKGYLHPLLTSRFRDLLTKVPLCDRFRGRLARKLECLDVTQSGPDAPAQSVGRVARLSGNVRQPNHVLAN